MARSRAETERLDRLTGTGEGSGGGLPLPDLFSAFLVELLDNGPAPTIRLVAIAQDKLEYKAARVTEGWGSWDSLTDDVLQQMASRGFIGQRDGTWELGESFAPGERLVIIPKRPGKNRNAIGVTVYPREEREEREVAADRRMTITELVGKLLPGGPGIRPVDRAQVEKIRESLPSAGHVYPVLVDKNGRILDGKHRKAADPDWPELEVEKLPWNRHPVDEVRALAVARVANMGQPLPSRVATMIDKVLGDSRAVQEAQRERIRAALLENPGLSHTAIAKRLDLHVEQVNRMCRDLITHCVISECGHRFTEAGKHAPGRKPNAAPPPQRLDLPGLRAEVERLRRAGQPVNRDALAERYGCGISKVQTVRAEVDAVLAAEQEREQETVQQRAYGAASLLSPDERAALADDLADSLPPEQQAEIVDRWLDDDASRDAGPVDDAPSAEDMEVLEQMVALALSRPREKRAWLISQLMARMP